MTLHIEALGIDLHVGSRLEVDMAVIASTHSLDVLVLKLGEISVAPRNDKVAENEHNQGYYRGTMKVGPQHTPIADTAAQNSDDLRVSCQLGSEEYHGDKDEQRTVEIDKSGDEIAIVVEHNLAKRSIVGEEIIQLLRHVEGDDDDDDQRHGEKKRGKIFLQDVAVYERILQFYFNFFKRSHLARPRNKALSHNTI